MLILFIFNDILCLMRFITIPVSTIMHVMAAMLAHTSSMDLRGAWGRL